MACSEFVSISCAPCSIFSGPSQLTRICAVSRDVSLICRRNGSHERTELVEPSLLLSTTFRQGVHGSTEDPVGKETHSFHSLDLQNDQLRMLLVSSVSSLKEVLMRRSRPRPHYDISKVIAIISESFRSFGSIAKHIDIYPLVVSYTGILSLDTRSDLSDNVRKAEDMSSFAIMRDEKAGEILKDDPVGWTITSCRYDKYYATLVLDPQIKTSLMRQQRNHSSSPSLHYCLV